MAFPTTSILDSGAGSDQNPIGGGWTPGGHFASGADRSLQRIGNQLASGSATADRYVDALWTTPLGAGDHEVYVTIPTVVASGTTQYVRLYLRVSALSDPATVDGYVVEWRQDGNAFIREYLDGSATQLATVSGLTMTAGDSFGVEHIASTGVFTVYHKTAAGAWTATGLTATDTTHTGAGYIGLATNHPDFRMTNFGGGVIAGGGATPAARRLLSGPFKSRRLL